MREYNTPLRSKQIDLDKGISGDALSVSCSDVIQMKEWNTFYLCAVEKFNDLNSFVGLTDRNVRIDEEKLKVEIFKAFRDRQFCVCHVTITFYPNRGFFEVWISCKQTKHLLYQKPVKIYSAEFLQ